MIGNLVVFNLFLIARLICVSLNVGWAELVTRIDSRLPFELIEIVTTRFAIAAINSICQRKLAVTNYQH